MPLCSIGYFDASLIFLRLIKIVSLLTISEAKSINVDINATTYDTALLTRLENVHLVFAKLI